MFNFKRVKTLLITLSSTAAISILLSHPALAATYTVQSGDSLYKIGTLFNTTASTIVKDNSLTGSTIYPGQALNVNCSVYTVKSGDCLSLIAKNSGISLYSLRKANNLWTDTIYVGQKLNLPAAAAVNTQASISNSVIPYTASDLDLLARLITAEAGNEPFSAKVAVGAVVINRVKSSEFPNTLTGVIYQRINGYYQFTPVLNGYINKPATQDSINAAYEALHGVDPTNGALFYFDDSTTNQWLWSKPIATRIDRMVFTY